MNNDLHHPFRMPADGGLPRPRCRRCPMTGILVGRDGTTTATLPDTREQSPTGWHLVAYHP